MDGPEQSSSGAAFFSTIDTDHVKSKNQDKEVMPDDQKPQDDFTNWSESNPM